MVDRRWAMTKDVLSLNSRYNADWMMRSVGRKRIFIGVIGQCDRAANLDDIQELAIVK